MNMHRRAANLVAKAAQVEETLNLSRALDAFWSFIKRHQSNFGVISESGNIMSFFFYLILSSNKGPKS